MFGPRDVTITPEEPSAAFVSVSDLKAYCGVTGSDQDDLFTGWSTVASSVVEAFCNVLFEEREVVETFYLENPTRNLLLTRSPLISLTTLKFYDTATDLNTFRLVKQAGAIRKKDNSSFECGDYEITYQAGFTTIPADVLEAVKQHTKDLRDMHGRQAGVMSERAADIGQADYRRAFPERGANGMAVSTETAALINHRVQMHGVV